MAETPRIRLDMDQHKAWLDGEPIHLPRMQFRLLAYLAAREGRVIPYQDLLRDVWGITWSNNTKALAMHLSWLRKRLGEDPAKPRYVLTVRGVGVRVETGVVEFVQPPTGPDRSASRVVLVKPGDVLVFGNVGQVSERVAATAGALRDQLRLQHVAIFTGDIDMTAMPSTLVETASDGTPAGER